MKRSDCRELSLMIFLSHRYSFIYFLLNTKVVTKYDSKYEELPIDLSTYLYIMKPKKRMQLISCLCLLWYCMCNSSNKKGFTLIEIIAVLAILGIITAIAMPKYFSLMEDSRRKAVQSALAEGRSRATSWGSQQYLSSGAWPTVDEYVAAADTIGEDGGDFRFSYRRFDAKTLRITGEGRTGTILHDIDESVHLVIPGSN
jgi:prepilin-type N-terminal cleavage/methylation domain-containing protein